MHHRTASVVPICSQPFEPTALIGRDPASLSTGRRAQHYRSRGRHDAANRGSISSESSEASSTSSSSAASASSSSASSSASLSSSESSSTAERASRRHHHHHHHASVLERSEATLIAEPDEDVNMRSTYSPVSDTSPGSSSSSSNGGSPLSPTTPSLFEAHLHYSRGLFDHTAKMWEADRQAIERSREKDRRDSVSSSARLSHVLGLSISSSSSSSASPTNAASASNKASGSGSGARRASDAANKSQQRALFAGALGRRSKSHRRGSSAVA